MALPRDHHNGLTTHFLLNIVLNLATGAVSNTPTWRCHYSKTSQHLCYFGKNNKKGGRVSVKKQSKFWRFHHRPFLDSVRWNGNHPCCHLTMVTLVIPLQSQCQYHCQRIPLVASLKLSRSVSIPGPSTNIRSVSVAQQSTVVFLTAINSALECSQAGAYDLLTKTYFKIKNYLTITIYKWLPGYGDFF